MWLCLIHASFLGLPRLTLEVRSGDRSNSQDSPASRGHGSPFTGCPEPAHAPEHRFPETQYWVGYASEQGGPRTKSAARHTRKSQVEVTGGQRGAAMKSGRRRNGGVTVCYSIEVFLLLGPYLRANKPPMNIISPEEINRCLGA